MNKNKTQMRISDAEFELLKSTFAESEELLKTIRNLFFGLPITDDEKKQITDLFGKNEPLRKLMRKQFLPEIQSDLPIGQAIDLWMTIDLKDKSPQEVYFLCCARSNLIKRIEKVLPLLENPEQVDVISFEIKGAYEDVYDNVISRNQFISHIDQQLAVMRTLAGMKTESVEDTKKRLLQDSSK